MFEEKDLTQQFPTMKREAESFLGRNLIPEALQAICVPLGSKDQSIRDQQASVVANILNFVKEADVPAQVDKLSEEDRANVVKFVYRAMNVYTTAPSGKSSGPVTEKNCNTMLKWLLTIIEKDGSGVIMKALVDTRV